MTFTPYDPTGQRLKSEDGADAVTRAFVARYAIAPAADAVDAVLAATALADGATTTVTEGIFDPDVPRALSVTGNQAGVAGDVVITGKDIAGNTITETIVANGAATVEGSKAFAEVTSIVLPALVGAGDTISVGTLDVYGIPHKLKAAGVLLASLYGNAADAGTLNVDASNLEANTYEPAANPNGSTAIDLYYLVN